MNAWSHLPNAQLIDWVIMSVKHNPEVWAAARAEAWNAARDAARDAIWDAIWDAGRGTAWNAARDASWDAALDAGRISTYEATRSAALDASWDAILALIAWDDSTQFLEMTSDELEVWARLSNNPAATLMLPAVKAIEQIAACLDKGSKSAYNHSHALI